MVLRGLARGSCPIDTRRAIKKEKKEHTRCDARRLDVDLVRRAVVVVVVVVERAPRGVARREQRVCSARGKAKPLAGVPVRVEEAELVVLASRTRLHLSGGGGTRALHEDGRTRAERHGVGATMRRDNAARRDVGGGGRTRDPAATARGGKGGGLRRRSSVEAEEEGLRMVSIAPDRGAPGSTCEATRAHPRSATLGVHAAARASARTRSRPRRASG